MLTPDLVEWVGHSTQLFRTYFFVRYCFLPRWGRLQTCSNIHNGKKSVIAGEYTLPAQRTHNGEISPGEITPDD